MTVNGPNDSDLDRIPRDYRPGIAAVLLLVVAIVSVAWGIVAFTRYKEPMVRKVIERSGELLTPR